VDGKVIDKSDKVIEEMRPGRKHSVATARATGDSPATKRMTQIKSSLQGRNEPTADDSSKSFKNGCV
jgi:hypothetical protein